MAKINRTVFPKWMSFRVVVYRSKSSPDYFTAHCLELDLIGQDASLEGAIAELLEAIESQLQVCAETGAQFEFWAPGNVWCMYEDARRAKRKVSDELMERIIRKANERLGYKSTVNFDTLAAGSQEVMDECLAQVV